MRGWRRICAVTEANSMASMLRRGILARVGSCRATTPLGTSGNSELEADLVDPETLETAQAHIRAFKVRHGDVAHRFERTEMTVEEHAQHVAHGLALAGQAHENGAPVDLGTFVMDIAALDELLEIVRHVGAQVVTARAQFARRQFLIADIEQEQRSHAVDLAFVAPI